MRSKLKIHPVTSRACSRGALLCVAIAIVVLSSPFDRARADTLEFEIAVPEFIEHFAPHAVNFILPPRVAQVKGMSLRLRGETCCQIYLCGDVPYSEYMPCLGQTLELSLGDDVEQASVSKARQPFDSCKQDPYAFGGEPYSYDVSIGFPTPTENGWDFLADRAGQLGLLNITRNWTDGDTGHLCGPVDVFRGIEKASLLVQYTPAVPIEGSSWSTLKARFENAP